MLISRALSGKSPANYPASLAPMLAAALAEGLAVPSSESQWPENKLGMLALLRYLYKRLPALLRLFITELFPRPKRDDDHGH
jgi:hypothetical protein